MTYSILFTTKKLQLVLEEMGLVALLLAFVWPWIGRRFLGRVERFGKELARHRRAAVLAAGLFPMACRLAMLPVYPFPKPVVHDEFSYLMQGETFAHGRLANPTPPFWEHFESEYVIFQPTYASQYQPLPGVFLALGQWVFGHPWFGVWIATGLMCASLCWALMAAVPPPWALFGAFAAALQFGIFGFWMNSYFGGSVAAAAGALVFGGLQRMSRRGSLLSSGAICAIGIVMLMASRPFEGIIWSLIAVVFTARTLRRDPARHPMFGRAVLVSSTILAVGAACLMMYDRGVTGDPLMPPYVKYRAVYGTPQSYWWQPPVIVSSFNNEQLKANYEDQYEKWQQRSSPEALLDSTEKRLRDFWRFFIGPLYTPALLFLPLVLWRDRRVRWWLIASTPFVLDHATYHAWYPQQTAPATILIVLLFVQCWRHMRVWRRNRGTGLALSRNLPATLAIAILLAFAGKAAEPLLEAQHTKISLWPRVWEPLYQAKRLRDDVTAQLEKIPGKHLLFVKYGAGHRFYDEWIFNSADIQNARVVYARPCSPESDKALAGYLRDHDVWVIEPDRHPYLLARVESDTRLAQLSQTCPEAPPPLNCQGSSLALALWRLSQFLVGFSRTMAARERHIGQ